MIASVDSELATVSYNSSFYSKKITSLKRFMRKRIILRFHEGLLRLDILKIIVSLLLGDLTKKKNYGKMFCRIAVSDIYLTVRHRYFDS